MGSGSGDIGLGLVEIQKSWVGEGGVGGGELGQPHISTHSRGGEGINGHISGIK